MSVNKNISISFEIFPPNTLNGFRKLKTVCQQLNQLNPNFFSVTFGAGGSSQLKTQRIVRQFTRAQVPTVPHLSCINMTKARLQQILDNYMRLGINRLVVIRGDFSNEADARDFNYAFELIEYIRKLTHDHFHITVAAYPEFHPQSENSLSDLMHFKRKVDAGANSAITQFFFNAEAYFRFVESCDKLGITIPIIPGIMPIIHYDKLLRFAGTCGTEIPLWLRKRLEAFIGDVCSIRAFGIEITAQLCEKLLLEGVQGLHFYTLNQVYPTILIMSHLFADKNCTEYLNYCIK